jgi:nicotinamidase-related amidase
MKTPINFFLPLLLLSFFSLTLTAEDLKLNVRNKIVPEPVVQHDVRQWKPEETAIIICDMWNDHTCKGAAARVAEMAPTMNKVITIARQRGVTIIHAPSDRPCMEFYADSPARKRILAVPADPEVRRILGGGDNWNRGLPSEENVKWPVDQSDGGCDCEPKCNTNPPYPWFRQIETLVIDDEKDVISDSGIAIASYMKVKGLKNVILMGVHTNMCVIGRPFGLRNQVKLGNNVVLMRDLTDTMYNSKSWPYVPHFKGTSLVIDHIEKYVCPTILSTDITGESPFRFKGDSDTPFADAPSPSPVANK